MLSILHHSLCPADGGSTAEPQHSHQARFEASYPTHEFHHGPWAEHWHLSFEAKNFTPTLSYHALEGVEMVNAFSSEPRPDFGSISTSWHVLLSANVKPNSKYHPITHREHASVAVSVQFHTKHRHKKNRHVGFFRWKDKHWKEEPYPQSELILRKVPRVCVFLWATSSGFRLHFPSDPSGKGCVIFRLKLFMF